LFASHPLCRKLALLLELQEQRPILYSDEDVLCFRPPQELQDALEKNGPRPRYIREETLAPIDSWVADRARALGEALLPDLNSGLLYLPRQSLDTELALRALEPWRPPWQSWFTEQSMVSLLLHQAKAVPLPRDRYVITNRRQFFWEQDIAYSHITARHFTRPVRHLLYMRGLPHLLSFAKQGGIDYTRKRHTRGGGCENHG